jgi:uncharacterized cupredoxin-like copper-binding protein
MKKIIALVLLLPLAACGAGEDKVSRLQPAGGLNNAPQIVAETDWTAPEEVRVTLSDYAFTPDHLVFHRDRATRLILQNTTDGDHSFVSEGFLRSIAVGQITGPNGVENAPWVEKIAVPAGTTRELWFVPGRFGAWTFECGVPGHALLGMKGVVDVVR